MINKTQGTERRIFRVKSGQVENTFPDETSVISSSFSSQMKMDDQNIRTEEEEETLANILSAVFT